MTVGLVSLAVGIALAGFFIGLGLDTMGGEIRRGLERMGK